MNKPVTHAEIASFPLGFTATSDGTNRRDVRKWLRTRKAVKISNQRRATPGRIIQTVVKFRKNPTTGYTMVDEVGNPIISGLSQIRHVRKIV